MSDIIQRRHERTAVNWIGLIRLADGGEIPCTIKDVSKGGMRVMAPQGQALPETFAVKVVGRELVFRVRLAWRREHHVGLQIEQIARLPKEAAAPAPRPEAPENTRLGKRERYLPSV